MAADVDVLVVGGGAQGLWLLNDLDKHGYRTVLLERAELGCGQTCHSHALIHRGHYYDDVDMMIILNAAAQFWVSFIETYGQEQLNVTPSLAGFGPGTAMERHKYFWRSAGLRFKELDIFPDVFTGGKVRYLFETEEFSLNSELVVENLVNGVDHCTYKIDGADENLLFEMDGRNVVGVHAVIDGVDQTFRPRFTVLAAGIGNLSLLKKLDADKNPWRPDVPVQARRKNHMLLLRGPHLPHLTAVFPIRGGLQGVFICARHDDDTGDTVWLVSDHNSTPFDELPDSVEHLDPAPSADWIGRILVSLKHTTPAIFDQAQTLDASVYTVPTSERNFGVGEHMTDCFIDPLSFDNALAIWPTKLTLTPFASNVAARFIRAKVPEPSGSWPTIGRPVLGPAPTITREMWRRAAFETDLECRTDWLPYKSFLDEWQLREPA